MKPIALTPAIVSLALALTACPAEVSDDGSDEANDDTTDTTTTGEETTGESETETTSESETDTTETDTTETDTTETGTETTDTETTETGDPEFPDLVGYWSFNNDMADHSGVNIDLTAVGDPEYQGSVSAGLGTAIALDGNDGAIGQDFVKIAGDDATIVAWVFAGDLDGFWNTIVKSWGDLEAGQFHLGLGPDVTDTLQSIIVGDAPVAAENDFPTGQWVHVAVVLDAAFGEHRLYIDGIHMATGSYVPPLDPGVATGLGIGVKPNDDGSMASMTPEVGWWHGRIDEVGLYAAALTQDQLTTLHQNGLDGVQLDGTSE